MVESREPGEMPEPSDKLEEMAVDEVLDLTLREAETDEKREAMMWKSVAAENVEDRKERPQPPEELEHLSEDELKGLELADAGGKEEIVGLLEWAVYPKT